MQRTDLQQKDQRYNWHPYTQHKTALPEIVITKAKDSIVFDEHNNQYIDAISSWWCNPFGHCNTHICNAIQQQTQILEHVLFGGFTHTKAIELSEKLIELLPFMQKVFYSDNGSTAVEVALKMSYQFFLNRNEQKNTIVAFEDAFHGDTFGAMSASGISLFTDKFASNFNVIRIPIPTDENISSIIKTIENIYTQEKVFAFIFEPLVLGAAGMKMYKAEHLDTLISLFQANKIITIADEVMTGFGRTGKFFACDYLTQKPDIICLSKALTAGFLPMAATLCKDFIYQAFHSEETEKAFFHGHTFTANPLGCATALASIELLTSNEMQKNINSISLQNQKFLQKISTFSNVLNARQLGVILAFELKTETASEYYGTLRNQLYSFFIDQRVILRPVGNTIYILPMYIITNEQLDRIYEVILQAIKTF